MAVQRGPNIVGRIRPLDTSVHPFGSLPEDSRIDERLVKTSIRSLANVVQRVSRKPNAGTHANIKIELLPHGDDRRVVDVAFAL